MASAGDPIGIVIRGAMKAEARVAVMERQVDLATLASLKKVQSLTRTSIRSGMRGRPRWDRRGASSRTGPEVNLRLNPHQVSKGGGPGKLSGALYSSIRKSRVPRRLGQATYSAVVLAGGQGGPQNLYKGKVEATYPYFVPGVRRAEPKMAVVWNAAYAKATR